MSESLRITTDSIDAVMAWTVIRAAREANRLLASVLKEHGLTPVEFGVLSQLAAHGEMTQAHVARATGIRPQSVAPLIDDLSDRGFLDRRGERGRGRSGRLALTESGSSLLAAVFPVVLGTNSDFVGGSEGLDVNHRLLEFLDRAR